MTGAEIERVCKPGNRRTKNQKKAEMVEVLRLKILGVRDQEVAHRLQMSLPTVKLRLQEAIAEYGESSVKEYREITKQQLEVLLAACMPGVEVGDVLAVNTALRILERKSRLLGLDAPLKVELETVEHTPQERAFEDLLAQAERDQKMAEADLTSGEG